MQDDERQDTTPKTIRLEKDLIKKIEEMRKGSERNFSQQVKYMLKKYIELVEDK